MKQTMEAMLLNSGYHAKVSIPKSGYKVSLAVSMSGTMTLEYPNTLTPGEVVFQVKSIFDTLNEKDKANEGN
jgi:hypothetical protein